MGKIADLLLGKRDTLDGVNNIIQDTITSVRGTNPELEHKLMQAQVELNKVEASSSSVFIAGWRPGLAWVCVFAMAYHYLFQPFVSTWVEGLPAVDIGALYPLILALLGLGTMRTTEKIRKVNQKH